MLPVISEIGVILAVLAILLTILSFRRAPSKSFPPGPIGLPFVGYLPFLGSKPHEVLFDLRKKYGPVFSIQLGTKLVVVLNSYDSIKEALIKPAFFGRSFPSPFQIDDEHVGFGAQVGTEWRDQRQFSFKILRNLGFGAAQMEDHTKDEIFSLLGHLRSRSGQAIEVYDVLNPSIGNVIDAFMIGRRTEIDDPKRILINTIAKTITPCFKQLAGVLFFPRPIRFLLKAFNNMYSEARKYTGLNTTFLEAEIASHQSVLQANNTRDFIDKYLLEMNDTTNKNIYFTKDNLLGNLRLLQGAGTDTILTTLQWALVAMAAFPKVQDKVQEEIDSVIGRDRSAAYSDRGLMPYTQATIKEIFRWRTNLPINVPRSTTSATSVGEFQIPANVTVVANLWAVHNDPELWESPEDFRPDRFLTKDTGLLDQEKSDILATFTFGPRSCPGKALANLEVFLFFVSILQKFRVTPPKGVTPSVDGYLYASYKPVQSQLVFTERL